MRAVTMPRAFEARMAAEQTRLSREALPLREAIIAAGPHWRPEKRPVIPTPRSFVAYGPDGPLLTAIPSPVVGPIIAPVVPARLVPPSPRSNYVPSVVVPSQGHYRRHQVIPGTLPKLIREALETAGKPMSGFDLAVATGQRYGSVVGVVSLLSRQPGGDIVVAQPSNRGPGVAPSNITKALYGLRAWQAQEAAA